MSDIFVSYARADRDRIRPLVQVLEKQGWSVWWDPGIQPGDEFRAVIERELNAARCVVVIWSQTSVGRNFVIDEANEGLKRGVLIPVLFDEVEMPLGFRQHHAARLTDWSGQTNHPELAQLIASITTKIGASPKKQDSRPSDQGQELRKPEEQVVRSTAQPPSQPTPNPTPKPRFFPGGKTGLSTGLRMGREGADLFLSSPRVEQIQNMRLDPAVRAQWAAERKAYRERRERLRLLSYKEPAWWISLAVLPAICVLSAFLSDRLVYWALSLFHIALPTRLAWWMLSGVGVAWGLAYAFAGAVNYSFRWWHFYIYPVTHFVGIIFGLFGELPLFFICLLTAWPVNLLVSLSLAQGLAVGLDKVLRLININLPSWLVTITNYEVMKDLLFGLLTLAGIVFFYLIRDEFDEFIDPPKEE